jgi:hypothetical protein
MDTEKITLTDDEILDVEDEVSFKAMADADSDDTDGDTADDSDGDGDADADDA